jgi:hypothetical protein
MPPATNTVRNTFKQRDKLSLLWGYASCCTYYPSCYNKTISRSSCIRYLLCSYYNNNMFRPIQWLSSGDSYNTNQPTNQPTLWLYSASKLYPPGDRRLSAKLVPTFADRRVSHGECGGSPTAVISVF